MDDEQDRLRTMSPAGRDAAELLAWLPPDWPIRVRNGAVSLAPSHGGYPLVSHLKRGGTDAQAYDAERRVRAYIGEINQQTAAITRDTDITTRPALVMGEPRGRNFFDVFGWHVLRARLQA